MLESDPEESIAKNSEKFDNFAMVKYRENEKMGTNLALNMHHIVLYFVLAEMKLPVSF